jgi:hypothetical protein
LNLEFTAAATEVQTGLNLAWQASRLALGSHFSRGFLSAVERDSVKKA